MSDIKKHKQIAATVETCMRGIENVRVSTITDLGRKRDHNQKMLDKAKERCQKLPEVIAKYSADIAALEAMTSREILLALLPEEAKKEQTVAEHDEKPGMYAIYNKVLGIWWHMDRERSPGGTLLASEARHVLQREAAQACSDFSECEAYRPDDLHTVDGLLKIKPGSKPATFPAVQS